MDKEVDGSPYVRLQIAVTDPLAAQKISDQRYLTGSVGGRAGKAVCSISGEDLAAESADGRPKVAKYKRGQVYKGKLAFVDMQDISFKEYSFVNQPADQRSSVRASKSIDGAAPIADYENWTAKSSAFILHMDKEEITTVGESESIFKNLKKKESRPLYLHLKGAFLTALAFEESETANVNNNPLLSEKTIDNEEIRSMSEDKKNEDVLATIEGLSQDLSDIAAVTTEEPTASAEELSAPKEVQATETEEVGNTEAPVEAPATEQRAAEEEILSEKTEEAGEQAKDVVDPTTSETSDEKVEIEESKAELTDEIKTAEQDANDEKLLALQSENAKLREALHRTLVERVVDTKISLGIESVEERESLIHDHVTRSAGSLADSLRDLAKMPATKKVTQKVNESVVVENDIISEKENNVIIEDEQATATSQEKVQTVEELFVDALMGRRKL